MGLVIGTSCGFVEGAPSADPSSGSDYGIDDVVGVVQDESPGDGGTITEMGWWCDDATEEANFEVGLYDEDSGHADTLLEVDRTNAKGTGAGWKVVTGLNWSVDASTNYWLGVQLDDTTTQSFIGGDFSVFHPYDLTASQTTLPNTYTGGASEHFVLGIYALIGGAPPPEEKITTSINVDDAWKAVSGATVIKVNIDDAWKNVTAMKVNKDDVWKTVTIS